MKGQFTIHKDAQHPDRPWRVEGSAGGRRRRAYFATRELAQEHARLENFQLRNFGQAAANIDGSLRIEALAAQRILAPMRASLLDAANFYAKHADARAKSVSVAQAWEGYKTHIKSRFESGTLKRRSIETIMRLVAKFVAAHAQEQICDLSSQRISEWLYALPCAAKSKDGYRLNVSGLFSYALKRGWIAVHPMSGGKVDGREFATVEKRPEILSVEQLAKLLEVAERTDPDLIPAIVIGAFAGLRPSEVHLLDWKDIHWDNAEIDINPEKCKTGRYRYVPIFANLMEWLEPYRKTSGPIFGGSLGRLSARISAVGRAAGIATWPADGLRHSYGSYEYARTGSADSTASQMGNSIEVLFAHYRNRVRKEEALAYFAIRPARTDKIVAIAA
jgi:integrase